MAKKKQAVVNFEFQKRYDEIAKNIYKFPDGSGFVQIHSTPFGQNMFKELVGDWREVENKTPIEEWVERWIKNEKSSSRI